MVLRLILLLVSGYAGLCLLVFLLQRRMLYLPTHQAADAALAIAGSMKLEPWRDESGTILGWVSRHPSKKPQGTLLVLHGNAGSALDRAYLRDAFQAQGLSHPLDVVLLEYPGYGPREGHPSEASLVGAAVEAIDRLKREHRSPLLLLGESLGSAAATLAAERRPAQVQGLLLVTPMKSVPAIARRHYPFLPTLLTRDRFQADRAMKNLHMPVGFLVAGQDEVTFPDLGGELYQTYTGPKRLWLDEAAGHNSLNYAPSLPQWQEMMTFALGAPP